MVSPSFIDIDSQELLFDNLLYLEYFIRSKLYTLQYSYIKLFSWFMLTLPQPNKCSHSKQVMVLLLALNPYFYHWSPQQHQRYFHGKIFLCSITPLGSTVCYIPTNCGYCASNRVLLILWSVVPGSLNSLVVVFCHIGVMPSYMITCVLSLN